MLVMLNRWMRRRFHLGFTVDDDAKRGLIHS